MPLPVSDKKSPPRTIALIGLPNAGKSTVFNRLTGASQKVGNFPGVTVERKEGLCRTGHGCLSVIDLPGLYSLAPSESDGGLDHAVARAFLATDKADVVLNVADATRLEQSLYLTIQLLESGLPVIVALNMSDAAANAGMEIDVDALSRRLGCPVIPISAAPGIGIQALRDVLFGSLPAAPSTPPLVHLESVESAVTDIAGHLADLPNPWAGRSLRFLALTLLEDDHTLLSRLPPDLVERVQAHRQKIEILEGEDADSVIAGSRFELAHKLGETTLRRTGKVRSIDRTDAIDSVALHPFLGIPLFLGVMYLMFMFTVHVGGAFIDFFDGLAGAFLVDGLGHALGTIGAPDWVTVLLAGGLGGGIQVVATFIPVVGALYLSLTVLEDTGYMARAAFVMDRAMNRIGLPGKAIVPLIIGFGCNVPAVMASRVMERPKDRILTIAMTPFMSCGARLAVYALFATAFFPSQAGTVVMGLYLIGIVAAIFTALLLRKTILAGDNAPFMLELPPYRMVRLKDVLLHTWTRLKVFMVGAGKIIVAVVMVLNILMALGTDGKFDHQGSETSILAQVSKAATPVFAPMGVAEDNWPAMVGIVTGLFAKEAVVGTLDTLYTAQARVQGADDLGQKDAEGFDLGGAVMDAFATIPQAFSGLLGTFVSPLGVNDALHDEEIQETLAHIGDALSAGFGGQALAAFSYLLFILLYVPCVAVLGAVKRELGWGWTGFVSVWTTGLAYIVASLTYQIGTFSNHPRFTLAWIAGCALVMGLVGIGLSLAGRRQTANRFLPPVSKGATQ